MARSKRYPTKKYDHVPPMEIVTESHIDEDARRTVCAIEEMVKIQTAIQLLDYIYAQDPDIESHARDLIEDLGDTTKLHARIAEEKEFNQELLHTTIRCILVINAYSHRI